MSDQNTKATKIIKQAVLFIVIPLVVLFSLLVGIYFCFPESNFSLKIKDELWLYENYRNAKDGAYRDNPTAHPNTRWVCQEVDMYFDHIEGDVYEFEGAITINGETQKLSSDAKRAAVTFDINVMALGSLGVKLKLGNNIQMIGLAFSTSF